MPLQIQGMPLQIQNLNQPGVCQRVASTATSGNKLFIYGNSGISSLLSKDLFHLSKAQQTMYYGSNTVFETQYKKV